MVNIVKAFGTVVVGIGVYMAGFIDEFDVASCFTAPRHFVRYNYKA